MSASVRALHDRPLDGTAPPCAEPSVFEIAPASAWPRLELRALWTYRELFFFLMWRDVKVRYAQTVLGSAWTILQPVLTMFVFTIVFGRLAKVPSDGVPYSLFVLSALIPWTYFSTALTGATTSLVSNANLISKVYFPRLVIPLASVLSGLVNLAITLAILLMALLMFRSAPAWGALPVLPLLLVIMMAIGAGVGCWLGALAVQYRDVRNLASFLVQLWMYACPIVYPLSLVPPQWRPIYVLNPMVGVIEGFRSVLLRTTPFPWDALTAAAAVSTIVLVTGVLYFRRMEQTFADVA